MGFGECCADRLSENGRQSMPRSNGRNSGDALTCGSPPGLTRVHHLMQGRDQLIDFAASIVEMRGDPQGVVPIARMLIHRDTILLLNQSLCLQGIQTFNLKKSNGG